MPLSLAFRRSRSLGVDGLFEIGQRGLLLSRLDIAGIPYSRGYAEAGKNPAHHNDVTGEEENKFQPLRHDPDPLFSRIAHPFYEEMSSSGTSW